MRILIAEDDMVSRKFLSKFLSQYGECDLTVDGLEALDAFLLSLKDNNPYDLVCLDISNHGNCIGRNELCSAVF
ncbi:MAG: cheY7 [Firmicutes bacterium]|nr:cheY7 [Bacillota bacterium]